MSQSLGDYQQTIRQLIPESFRLRLINQVRQDKELDPPLAERIIDQTLVFLKFVADNPGKPYAPSPLVDIGWHAFLLHTRRYSDFCREVAGGFIHHDPADEDFLEASLTDSAYDISRTTIALTAANLPVDTELWNALSKCGGVGCTNGDCTSGGPP